MSSASYEDSNKRLTQDDYSVGWICAIPTELTAATAILEVIHPNPVDYCPDDRNVYTFGSIGEHNIVISCLPFGRIGNNEAATSATQMVCTFPSIKIGLMVGIGGGIPPKVKLGDVVISAPSGQYAGVVQWDLGKAEANSTFKRTGALNGPPGLLLRALAKMRSDGELYGHNKISQYLLDVEERWQNLNPKYTRSECLEDPYFAEANGSSMNHPVKSWRFISWIFWQMLYFVEYFLGLQLFHPVQHTHSQIQEGQRQDDKSRDLCVHYGLIASGNQVIKDARVRDTINNDLGGNVLCIEMEAAGLMNDHPFIVIRGICDYADGNKNDDWQPYASCVAAACAKELLGYVEPSMVIKSTPIKDMLTSVMDAVGNIRGEVKVLRNKAKSDQDLKVLEWLTTADYGSIHSSRLAQRQPGTCQWFLDSENYQNWLSSSNKTMFCPGIPGAGKTILASAVIDSLLSDARNDQSIGVAYIYFEFNRRSDQTVDHVLASLIKQLCQSKASLPSSLRELYKAHSKARSRPSTNELDHCLSLVLASFSKSFLVIDALDEYLDTGGSLSNLLSRIFALGRERSFSILATSREIEGIRTKFPGCIEQHISALDLDIRKYLDEHTSHLEEITCLVPGLHERMKASIVESADGMFLLARLNLASLAEKTSPKAIETSLRILPKGSGAYDQAYDECMKRIHSQASGLRDLADKVLIWITHAERPLAFDELQHALAVEIGGSEFDPTNISPATTIVSVCGGLVVIDGKGSMVRLVHYTTQEYFETSGDVDTIGSTTAMRLLPRLASLV